MKKILVICWGNIHRSVIAEQMLLNALRERGLGEDYSVASRGIQGTMQVDPPRHPNLRDYPEQYAMIEGALERYGVHIPMRKAATPITAHDAEDADLILVLGNEVAQKLNVEWKDRPELLRKMQLLAHIEDPYLKHDADILQQIVDKIHTAVSEFVSSLQVAR